jgi:hypothetical protein
VRNLVEVSRIDPARAERLVAQACWPSCYLMVRGV